MYQTGSILIKILFTFSKHYYKRICWVINIFPLFHCDRFVINWKNYGNRVTKYPSISNPLLVYLYTNVKLSKFIRRSSLNHCKCLSLYYGSSLIQRNYEQMQKYSTFQRQHSDSHISEECHLCIPNSVVDTVFHKTNDILIKVYLWNFNT